MITVAGTANAIMMAGPRLIFAMSRDGLLPKLFQSVNGGGTPDAAMLLMAMATLALAATGSFALVFGLIALMDTVGAILMDSSGKAVIHTQTPDLAQTELTSVRDQEALKFTDLSAVSYEENDDVAGMYMRYVDVYVDEFGPYR